MKRKRLIHAAGCMVLGAATCAIGLGPGTAPLAQEAPAEARCNAIISIIYGVIREYHGQISADLISDLQKKVGTDGKCDGPDEYRVWPNTKDREALGRIRQLISVWDVCRREPTREGCQAASSR